MNNRKITEVVGALIWQNGKFLICKRPANKSCALMWEFVGGKLEDGESKEQALVRECNEELAITVGDLEYFCEVSHVYPDITVHLTIFNAKIVKGEPKLLEHADFKWITPSELDCFEFCPADVEILQKIKKVYG